MVQVTRLVSTALNTKDIESMVSHYQDVLGLTMVERGDDGNVYLSTGVDHHNVILVPAKESGLHTMSFQIGTPYSMQEVVAYLKSQGIQSERKTDAEPGIAELVELQDPDGNRIRLFAEQSASAVGFQKAGVVPNKIGHIALRVQDAKRAVHFYEAHLGFRVSDWMADFFCFMRCNSDHHTVNFLQAGSGSAKNMHHVAFELQDWAHVKTSTDHLSKHGKPLLWGPLRHGIGHNIALYHHDAEDNIVELYTELDIMNEALGSFEPRPWHEEFPQRPKVWTDVEKAASLWGGHPPEGFM